MNFKLGFFGALLLVSQTAFAWNIDAKHVHQLEFFDDGKIRFTLYESGDAGATFQCGLATGAEGLWFEIGSCSTYDHRCFAATDRMASMLLAAELSGSPVRVHREECAVSRVALAP